MSQRIWLVSTPLLWLLLCCHNLSVSAQSQNAIGAHRLYQKTSFSCAGRPSGYYADVETGCQVYHMCDGLGRQFSYSCPNTTLFQQRMLICDHWYMVNCSKAESHYTANLLIGQRDKPFVNDEENNLRTPRPDLLDRPYAPDYSGESFRNQYQKSLSPALNQIFDGNAQKNKDKPSLLANSQNTPQVGQQRWKIPSPSRVILPPAYEPQIQNETTANTRTTSKVNYFSSSTTTQRPSTLRPTVTSRGSQGGKLNNVAALHIRHDEHLQYEHDDLGTSHSTRYNTSADFNSAEDKNTKNLQKNGQRKRISTSSSKLGLTSTRITTTTTAKPFVPSNIKVPSKIYEPPLLYPIYNLDEPTNSSTTTTTTTTTTARPTYRASTASPFVTRQTTARSTTTTRAPSRATTVLGKPFTRSPAYSTTTQSGRNLNDISRFDANKLSKEIRTPAPAQGFKSPTPRPSAFSTNTTKSPLDSVPSKHLQPPFTDFIQHDVATTQGPPIYYEWKVPSDGLEPPKLEAPIGVDGREYPEAAIDYSSKSADASFAFLSNFGIDQKKPDDKQPSRTPTSRSIKESAQPNGVSEGRTRVTTPTKAATQTTHGPPDLEDIFNIRKELSVPDYSFPLENAGRTGYLSSDVYNSFQLKIPERRGDTSEPLHWFGENPKCPECHPSYVKPGTCEPCLRR